MWKSRKSESSSLHWFASWNKHCPVVWRQGGCRTNDRSCAPPGCTTSRVKRSCICRVDQRCAARWTTYLSSGQWGDPHHAPPPNTPARLPPLSPLSAWWFKTGTPSHCVLRHSPRPLGCLVDESHVSVSFKETTLPMHVRIGKMTQGWSIPPSTVVVRRRRQAPCDHVNTHLKSSRFTSLGTNRSARCFVQLWAFKHEKPVWPRRRFCGLCNMSGWNRSREKTINHALCHDR